MEIYHGSGEVVEFPEIRKTKYTKDFSWGFYCTNSYEQAYRWAERKHNDGIVNVYEYVEDNALNIKKFDQMSDEWLDFINDFINGDISREVFWEYAKFKHPTHQISFHSIRAINCLQYVRSVRVNEHE